MKSAPLWKKKNFVIQNTIWDKQIKQTQIFVENKFWFTVALVILAINLIIEFWESHSKKEQNGRLPCPGRHYSEIL